MIVRFRKINLVTVALSGCTLMLFCAPGAAAAKLKFAGQFGREVNESKAGQGLEAEDICLVQIGDTCRLGKESEVPVGFKFPTSVAVDKASGDVYIADTVNNRIQKLGAHGEFLLMWGKNVNKTAVNEARTTEENVCPAPAHPGDECQRGIAGSKAGDITLPESIAVDNTCVEDKRSEPACKEADPYNGYVYVADTGSEQLKPRVDEFTPEGQFVRMFGGKVNKGNGGNICEAGEECQAGQQGTANGFFQAWVQFQGNLLTVGGPEHLVYVADEGRVQEFEPTGSYKTQITLTSTTPTFPAKGKVTALAVDGKGDVYLTESYVYFPNEEVGPPKGIYEFAPGNGAAIRQIDATDSHIDGLALDGSGHLAITDYRMAEGTLIDLEGGASEPSKFGPPGGLGIEATGLSFNAEGVLYLADINHLDIEFYTPVIGPEVVISETDREATQDGCQEGLASGTLATIECTLQGEIDPEGVSETEAWFEWGTTSLLGEKTSAQSVATGEKMVLVFAPLVGLVPNQEIFYRLATVDQNFPSTGQPIVSAEASFVTPVVPPRIVGKPDSAFIKSTSAVLSGLVNPEHTISEYFAEYGPGEALEHCPNGVRKETCSGVVSTAVLTSEKYQAIGATFEATGLQPSTTYHFRLNAINAQGQAALNETGGTSLPEGEFTTDSSVTPQAVTGNASNVSATSAVISGQVNADGKPASFVFEVGIYNGANTQYGIVASGFAGEGTALVGEELQLSGLQPATAYAYRIKIESAYGTSYGASMTFKTEGLPAVLPSSNPPVLLPMPQITLPEEPKTPKRPLTRAQKLKKALQACKHRRSRKQRLSCDRITRKRYGPRPKKKHGKRK